MAMISVSLLFELAGTANAQVILSLAVDQKETFPS